MRMGFLLAFAVLALAPPVHAGEPVVAYTITDGSEITASLTGASGDSGWGASVFALVPRAGCAGCHGAPGETGPRTASNLGGIGGRMTPGAIRLWIVAPAVIAPETQMPAFYLAGQRDGADDPLYGGPMLTAAEIEDLVAYLAALKDAD